MRLLLFGICVLLTNPKCTESQYGRVHGLNGAIATRLGLRAHLHPIRQLFSLNSPMAFKSFRFSLKLDTLLCPSSKSKASVITNEERSACVDSLSGTSITAHEHSKGKRVRRLARMLLSKILNNFFLDCRPWQAHPSGSRISYELRSGFFKAARAFSSNNARAK